ncbi:MAG TPA: polynucleotide kinase-phosphatase [Caldilineaceae bacterium]|nr:polynucleotide kinase-phosphatase [Caldilineaceae bacterium]
MNLVLPDFCLVLLIGASGSGKSTFARAHFLPTEVVSSDFCRGLVSDDENDQSASRDAFEVLHFIAAKRLARRKLTVIDATNVQRDARRPLLALAREYHALPVAIVLDLPERLCLARNRQRPDRSFGPQVIARQRQDLRRSLGGLQREGFRRVFVLKSEDEVAAASVTREPLWTDRRWDHGPFDIIGDVHGCYDELLLLLERLGYTVDGEAMRAVPPAGRKAVFLGDLVDRGPKIPQVLRLVMGMVAEGTALCLPGNHDDKLMRKLRGRTVQVTHGLAESLAQLADEPPEFRQQVADFIDSLVSHYVLDEGRLVVAHAGMKESMAGRASGAVRDFALYGETTGETDEFGLPVRHNWAAEYRGAAMVVYGHTPAPSPEWLNRTINIDTGCVFGGALTALRYPERELVSVPALETYAAPAKPFLPAAEPAPALTVQQQLDDVLDIGDVLVLDNPIGKRVIQTRLQANISIRAENAAAALEVMSRFAVNPKWLVYLPPTMSPVESSTRPDLLEHPEEAFAYFRSQGVAQVICQEKHMGSRAIVVVCQDEDAARRRFGVVGEGSGIIYTRTGRRFFPDETLERQCVAAVQAAATQARLWEELQSDWLVLDCELMPWSVKAQELLQSQYAAVGAAAREALRESLAVLEKAASAGLEVGPLLALSRERAALIEQYSAAYRRYCWPVTSLADLRLAPFHLLASEGAVHVDQTHRWHMEKLAALCAGSDVLPFPTTYQIVDVGDEGSVAEATRWWESLTGQGGEGMVVKPLDFIARGRRGLIQPAVKVRGREYLRLIYGPDYTRPEQLTRLRVRGLSAKRSLALREFALGIEALERFVRREPLRRVHECVFAVLALESEPVDPRL